MNELRRILSCILLLLIVGALVTPMPLAAQEITPAATLEDPTVFAADVSGFVVRSPVLYWLTNPTCPGPGPNTAPADTADADDPVTIQRIRTTGSEIRRLFERNDARPPGQCNPYQILSNLVVDESHVYWMDAAGLQKLPLTANPGDTPTLLLPFVVGADSTAIADGGDQIYGYVGQHVWRVDKTDGSKNYALYTASQYPTQIVADGVYVYVLSTDGVLRLVNPSADYNISTLASNVGTFHAPGGRQICGDGLTQWLYSSGGVGNYQYLNYAGGAVDDLRFGDFNGDGKTDVFAALPRAAGGLQWVYSSGGVGGYQPIAWDYQPLADLRFGDFNGDGKTDVFTAVPRDGGGLQWIYSSGGAANYQNLNFADTPLADLRFGDFDGDGKTDIFTALPLDNGVFQWVYSSAGLTAYQNLAQSTVPLADLRFGDFNGDGKTDVFAALPQSNGDLQWVYSSGGAGSFQHLNYVSSPLADLRFGDFNGDGKTDVFTTRPRDGGGVQWVYSSGGTGGYQNMAYAGQPLADLRFGDFDGDGKTDVFATTPREGCKAFHPLFYNQGRTVRWADLATGNGGIAYTSPATRGSGNTSLNYFRTSFLASDASRLFVFEDYSPACPGGGCFRFAYDYLVRVPLSLDFFKGFSGGVGSELYIRPGAATPLLGNTNLTSDGTFLFWMNDRTLYRLPADAAALPKINLRITGMEITQGIQNSNNSIRLIRRRDTYVRLFVKSDGANVPDVSARLTASWPGVANGGSVSNLDRSITVQGTPSRWDLNQSFLFRLPWEWTEQTALTLRADLNPFGIPLEPTYEDNIASYGPFNFQPSPRLDLIFAEMSYTLGGTTYEVQGTLKNVNWINKVYPLGYIEQNGNLEPGLQYEVWEISDAGLAARVNRQLPECEAYVVRNAAGVIIDNSNLNLCASDYVNSQLNRERTRRAVPSGTFIYGAIPDPGPDNQFPRGQAGANRVTSGPDRNGEWDGFYAGHEVGHAVGLGHPATGNGQCNLEGSDATPTHPNAQVGPNDDTVNGLYIDYGTRRLIRGRNWTDFMAYCNSGSWPFQWTSDQNYNRIYDNLPKPGNMAAAAFLAPLAGDWLGVYGVIAPDGEKAALHVVERSADVTTMPDRVPGPFAIRLLNGNGGTLATYEFTPAPSGDGDEWQSFAQVVTFAPGTRSVQIVRVADNKVLTSHAISASPPSVSDVSLAAPPTAEDSAVTLSWQASDADGDVLTFGIYYSNDGGASFQPLRLGVTGRSAEVEIGHLGGGTGIFRVIASDGAQSAEANSPEFTMPVHPPQIRQISPADAVEVQWGQPLNVSAEVWDPQDGFLHGGSLQWALNGNEAGFGGQLTLDDLPVGAHTLTLVAYNSEGLSATATVQLTVVDDLSVPGAQLSVSPTTLTWNVDGDNRTPQTADLTLVNSGGGTLTWTAQSSAAWLTLSEAEGSAPATVTLTGDPTGLAAESKNEATVTFTATDGDGNSIGSVTVDVTLWVDPSGYVPPGAETMPLQNLYMPVVQR